MSSQDITLFRASPGDIITDVVANLTTLFKGTVDNATKCAFFVGDLADPNGFGTIHTLGSTESTGYLYENWSIGTDKGAYLLNASIQRHKIYTLATLVKARFIASSYLASVTAGAIDVYTFCAQCE